MICAECKTEIGSRNYGFVNNAGDLIDICSFSCRKEYRFRAAANVVNGVEAGFAGTGKGRARNGRQTAGKPQSKKVEAGISKAVADLLDHAAAFHTRTQAGAIPIGERYIMLCAPGTPDRFAAIGVPVWFEIKQPGKKPTIAQRAVISELKDNGCLAFVVDDPDQARAIVAALKARADQIDQIRDRIRDLQTEIEKELDK